MQGPHIARSTRRPHWNLQGGEVASMTMNAYSYFYISILIIVYGRSNVSLFVSGKCLYSPMHHRRPRGTRPTPARAPGWAAAATSSTPLPEEAATIISHRTSAQPSSRSACSITRSRSRRRASSSTTLWPRHNSCRTSINGLDVPVSRNRYGMAVSVFSLFNKHWLIDWLRTDRLLIDGLMGNANQRFCYSLSNVSVCLPFFQTFNLSNYVQQQSNSGSDRSAFTTNFLAAQLPDPEFFQPAQTSVIANSGWSSDLLSELHHIKIYLFYKTSISNPSLISVYWLIFVNKA